MPPNTACTGEYWALKPVAIGNSTYQLNANTPQNYPNPLSESGEFKTVIPFEVSSASDAVITIIDETGRKVFEDMMEVKSSGKHSFNFTGDQLPAGKYFYSIESPKGVVIVQKSMLIVR